ncbi:hypothetical protein D6D28_10522 [Aureobasidium pullulans]|uniref:Cap binding protein n=1 Tax=Aureobasidium pullulans TaxID=5580 RepID=A0A4S8RZS0_AURPU|nr:hypothetical protein D6D28_10522 [Aureobasidium pullulans]
MARQTEIEKQLIMARKKIGYEELVQIEEKADVEMEDVQMEGAKVIGEEEAAAEVLTQLGKFSISAKAEVPRAPRRLAPLPRRARRKVASDAVHRFVQRNDYDKDLENRMADDRRGGGNFNRKRRFNRDDDEGGYDRRPQRRRYEDAPPGTRLRRQLLAVAESPMRNPEDEVKDIAKLVTDNYHDNYVKETYCDLVLSLVLEQPFKIPFVAASVLCANNEKSEAAAEVLNRTSILLQRHLDAGEWRNVKLLLRFLACLQPLFSDDGVFGILNELFDRAVDLQTASSDDAVGLELVKIILFTIPYVLAAPGTGLEEKAAELLEKTDIVASTPHALEALVDPYPTAEGEQKPMACPSILSALQTQLQGEAASGWKLECIPRLTRVTSPAPIEGENGEQAAPGKHSFPQLSVPSPVNPGPHSLFPEVCFSLFADQDVESVPPTSNIAASLLRDAVTDTINILDFNRNAAAKFLIDVDCYWRPDTFVKRATAFDKLKDIPEGRSTWKPEDLVVDAVFSQILRLPTSEHKLVYYHSVITEACKIAPAAVAPSLGRAIRFLFRSLDVMDLELQYRYMDWFAHHLSNFEFRWKWAEWIDDLERSDLEPRKAFIVGSLDKEIRLSFAKRIRETLPEAYAPLISEGKMKDTPDFKYLNEQTPYSQQGNAMHALIRRKAPEEEIEVVINEIQALASEHGVEDVLVPSTDAYMTSICSVGSKSLSHVLSCIERCKERLLAIGPQSEPARRQIITSVIDYWADHPGTAVNIIDKLLNYTIITPMSVIEWALHDHMQHGRALAQTHIYEMISATMFKVSNRMRQIVRARAEADLSEEQKALLDETLVRERQTMRDLFNAIIEAVSTVANAAQDDMIERFDGDSAEQTLLQQWGARWARVWRRKMAVEEAVVGEAAIEIADVARETERVKAEAQAAEAAATAAAEQPADTNMEQEDHDVA